MSSDSEGLCSMASNGCFGISGGGCSDTCIHICMYTITLAITQRADTNTNYNGYKIPAYLLCLMVSFHTMHLYGIHTVLWT